MGLGHMGEEKQWTRWRRDEWRLVPEPGPTTDYVTRMARNLFVDRVFPPAVLSDQAALSFRLERRRRQGNGLLGWLMPHMEATIKVYLEDRRGGQYRHDRPNPEAVAYLTRSDVLMYFFDPTYDLRAAPEGETRSDSFSYFHRMADELRLAAVRQRGSRGLYRGALQQHLAVCIPKLDEKWLFEAARRHGCMELDPDTRLPWVPPGQARRFFEAVTYDLCSIDADYLRREVSRTFHPKRTSYHALSSIGYYMPDGYLSLTQTSNRADPPLAEIATPGDGPAPSPGLRGSIVTPIHVLDPLISLVERSPKLGGRQ